MRCKGKICNKAVYSQSVTLSGSTVIINIPQRSFNNGEQFCLFVIQNVPTTALVSSPVVVTIGTDTTQYPLTRCNCAPVTACGIRTRRRYPIQVATTATGATMKVLDNLNCSPGAVLSSIPATTATPTGGATT